MAYEFLRVETQAREGNRTESIAVGSKEFVDATAERLGIRRRGRKVIAENGGYELREPAIPYNSDFDPKKWSSKQ